MKKMWYFTLPCLLVALASLTLPFLTRLGNTQVFYGYQYIFVDIAVGIIFLITLLSFLKRSINSALLGLMFSLANLFFTLFLTIVITVYNTGKAMDVVRLGVGAYLLLTIAPILVVIAVSDCLKSYKKKSI